MYESGIYAGMLRGGQVGESRNGKPYMALTFTITQVAVGQSWEPVEQETDRTVRLFLSDAALPYTNPKLQNLGFNGRFDDPQFSVQEPVVLECRLEEYEGKMQERWDFPYAPTPIEPPASDVLRRLNAVYGNFTAANRQPDNKPPAAPAQPQSQTPYPVGYQGESQAAPQRSMSQTAPSTYDPNELTEPDADFPF